MRISTKTYPQTELHLQRLSEPSLCCIAWCGVIDTSILGNVLSRKASSHVYLAIAMRCSLTGIDIFCDRIDAVGAGTRFSDPNQLAYPT